MIQVNFILLMLDSHEIVKLGQNGPNNKLFNQETGIYLFLLLDKICYLIITVLICLFYRIINKEIHYYLIKL